MSDFISLEEFLVLPDSSYDQNRLWSPRFCGEEWLFRYNLAKASYEKYGDNPPDGATVSVLVNGHGTSMPELYNVKSLRCLPKATLKHEENNSYFILLRPPNNDRSLVDKKYWWRSILIEETDTKAV